MHYYYGFGYALPLIIVGITTLGRALADFREKYANSEANVDTELLSFCELSPQFKKLQYSAKL